MRLAVFILIPAIIILVVSIVLPPTPRTSTSLLFAKIDKDQLLENTPSRRLIMIGGSNLSLGVDSHEIQERTNLNPVNTAIHASIGLKFMMDQTKDYIQPGDVIIISSEYVQFFNLYAYGGDELLRTVLDVDRSGINDLNTLQWIRIIRFVPKYSISKLKPSEYIFRKSKAPNVHLRSSYNEYGDVDVHWSLEDEIFGPYPSITGFFNQQVIKDLQAFDFYVTEKGAKLYITYPGLGEDTFNNIEKQIRRVEDALINSGLTIIGTPDRYLIPQEYLFDSPYHLNRTGVDYRTNLLIEDLLSVLEAEK